MHNDFDSIVKRAEEMTYDELRLVIDGYLSLINGHNMVVNDLQSKVKTLREIHHRKLLK